jgi:peptidoglycan-associated lipoprotein
MNPPRPLFLALALVVAVSFAGCAKKKAPVTPPEAAPVAAPVVEPPPPPPPPPPADPVPDPLAADLVEAHAYAYRAGLLGDVFFDFDRAELRAEARERLSKNAEFLRQRPEFTITIEGHCDERGTSEYNLALGERRAQAARAYLMSLGISEARLRSVSYGEERPVCRDADESCWQQNRRAHFLLTGRVPGG